MKNPIKIGLVENNQLFRKGMIALLNEYNDLKVVFESADGHGIQEKLEKHAILPDVMLINLTLSLNQKVANDGIAVLKKLNQFFPNIKCIIISTHDDPFLISKMMEEGAKGYLVKDCNPDQVYKTILKVYKNGSQVQKAQKLIQKNNKLTKNALRKGILTKREVEVLQHICLQMTSEEIATKLFIRIKTVHGHRENLLHKTNSKNVTGLVMYAIKNNLVELT